MATLTVVDSSVDGGGALMTLTAAAGGGDDFANDAHTVFIVANGDASPMTVTFDSVVASNYGSDDDVAETVAAGATRIFGPFALARYSSTVSVAYSSVTALTVNPFKIPTATITL